MYQHPFALAMLITDGWFSQPDLPGSIAWKPSLRKTPLVRLKEKTLLLAPQPPALHPLLPFHTPDYHTTTLHTFYWLHPRMCLINFASLSPEGKSRGTEV